MATASFAMPQCVEETGIRKNLLEDLALKTLFMQGELSLVELSEHMHISLAAIEEIFQVLRREQLCEVKGMSAGSHRIVASGPGKRRALELLTLNQYAGPAPVSLADYVAGICSQSVQETEVRPPAVERAFCHLVLSPEILERLGTAVVSGTSIFLYGPSGTGKTSIAESITNIYNDSVWIPYAVEVDGQIITVYDSGVHREVEMPASDEYDKRWIRCRRPRVIAGGEMTQEMLDLQFSPISRFYTAPLQMKANNGVLVVDDFGRQRMGPEELLNRWMTPLDRRIDYLTLPGGRKFEIPFDLFVVFSTNLNPKDLVEEAFLRRIQNKIKIDHVSREQFTEIFHRVCDRLLIQFDAEVLDYVIELVTKELQQPLRPCYPRDILNQIFWAANYSGKEARLDRGTVDQACRNYFLSVDRD